MLAPCPSDGPGSARRAVRDDARWRREAAIVKEQAPAGSGPDRPKPEEGRGVAREAVRLDAVSMRGTERPLAHGSFRRTGAAGSASAQGGSRICSGRPWTRVEPGLSPGPPVTAACVKRLHGTVPGPTPCDASRARPSVDRSGYTVSHHGNDVKNKSRTSVCSQPSPIPSPVMAGLVPAIPVLRNAAPQKTGIPGTSLG